MAETRAELVTALKAPVFDLTQEYLAGASAPVSRGAVLFHCLSLCTELRVSTASHCSMPKNYQFLSMSTAFCCVRVFAALLRA
jgi:hypothetical protein